MSSIIKNIIILAVVAIILILAYVFFLKPAPDQSALTSSTGTSTTSTTSTGSSAIGGDFLTVLLNVKSIKLDDSIFSDPAFATLRDSSIQLVSDGTEGRPNPFAPIGSDVIAAPINALTPNTNSPATTNPGSTNTPTTQTPKP